MMLFGDSDVNEKDRFRKRKKLEKNESQARKNNLQMTYDLINSWKRRLQLEKDKKVFCGVL